MGSEPSCLIIRADASPTIGVGHFMRCLALAQTWIELGGRSTFAMTAITSPIEAQLRSVGAGGFSLGEGRGDAAETAATTALATREGARWIVADGYRFSAAYQRALRQEGHRLLFVDDDGRQQRYEADLILNQNAHAAETLYADRPATAGLLLGPRYALLRAQFRAATRPVRTFDGPARKVLVTMGGADPDNVTQRVIEAMELLENRDLEVIVVVGGSNAHGDKLERAAAASATKMSLVRDAKNMPELMAWADLAVSAAGSTTLELAYMGVPMLLLVIADNQQGVAERMESLGAAQNLGWAHTPTVQAMSAAIGQLAGNPEERARLSRTGSALVDGNGSRRVVQELRRERLSLRLATSEDAAILWTWANDPVVRASAYSQAAIPWEHHVKWLEGKLQNEACCLLIASDEAGLPVGQIRFDFRGHEAEIDLSLAAAARGRGLGSELIRVGVAAAALTRSQPTTFRAEVKASNVKSLHSFLRAGFHRDGEMMHDGEPIVCLKFHS